MNYVIVSSEIKNERRVRLQFHLLSENKPRCGPLGTLVTKKASFKENKITDLIETVELRNARSEQMVFQSTTRKNNLLQSSLFSPHNSNDLFEMAEQAK